MVRQLCKFAAIRRTSSFERLKSPGLLRGLYPRSKELTAPAAAASAVVRRLSARLGALGVAHRTVIGGQALLAAVLAPAVLVLHPPTAAAVLVHPTAAPVLVRPTATAAPVSGLATTKLALPSAFVGELR